jgi:hypothetical protein
MFGMLLTNDLSTKTAWAAGAVIAHEMCHILGLGHRDIDPRHDPVADGIDSGDNQNNLMAATGLRGVRLDLLQTVVATSSSLDTDPNVFEFQ